MENQSDYGQIAVQIALRAWADNVKKGDALLASLSDAQFEQQIAPGKNRGTYLIGHLIAEHDETAELVGMGERKYSHYDAFFLNVPDRNDAPYPPMLELRASWKDMHERATAYFNQMSPAEWFGRHNRISEEDFKTQPLRNRFAVLTTRNEHFAYHLGQLVLLKR